MSSAHPFEDFLAQCECSTTIPTIPAAESGSLPDNSNRTALYQSSGVIRSKEICLAELRTSIATKKLEVDAKLAALNAAKASLAAKQAQLGVDTAALDAAIARRTVLEAELAAKVAALDAKQAELETLQTQLAALEAALAPLVAATEAAEAAKLAKDAEVVAAQAALAALQATKTAEEATLAGLQTGLAALIANLAANPLLSTVLQPLIDAAQLDVTAQVAVVAGVVAQIGTATTALSVLVAAQATLNTALETAQAAQAAQEVLVQAKNDAIDVVEAAIDALQVRILEIGQGEAPPTSLLGALAIEIAQLQAVVDSRTALVVTAQAAVTTAQAEYDAAKAEYDEMVAAEAELVAQIAAEKAERAALIAEQIEWEVVAVEKLIKAVGEGNGVTTETSDAVSRSFPSSRARHVYDDIVDATPSSEAPPDEGSAFADYREIALRILNDPSYYFSPESSDYDLLEEEIDALIALMRARAARAINLYFAGLGLYTPEKSVSGVRSRDYSNSAALWVMIIALVAAVLLFMRRR